MPYGARWNRHRGESGGAPKYGVGVQPTIVYMKYLSLGLLELLPFNFPCGR